MVRSPASPHHALQAPRAGVLSAITCLVALGCSNDERPDAARGALAEAAVPLDCVVASYPCTWAEMDSAAWIRTGDLAHEATRRLEEGTTPERVAAWLRQEPDVGSVLYDSLFIRFRLARGRPVWVGTPEAATLGLRGAGAPPPPGLLRGASVPGAGSIAAGGRAPAPRGSRPPGLAQASQQADPVGSQTPGKRPVKSVLFLDPYRWEFYLDVADGIIPVSEDASNAIPRVFQGSRDYRCVPGKPCPCPGGQCFEYVGNDWVNMCDPASPSCQVDVNVTLEDFKRWKDYDVIHVASHGSTLCDNQGNNCAGGIASGRFVLGDLKEWAETTPLAGYPTGAEWLYEPGVELVLIALYPFNPTRCSRLTKGTPGWAQARCDTGEDVWREYLGADFFKAHYKPGDLKDKLIFLSSCSSISGTEALSKFLAGPGNENAVVGWTTSVVNSSASRAATVFYTEWLEGKTAEEAFLEVKKDPLYKDLAFRGQGILRGGTSPTRVSGAVASTIPSAPARASTGSAASRPVQASPQAEGLSRKRGVETVRLLDPTSETEIPDGGTISLTSRPGDGRPDTLDALLEVVSVDSSEDPAEYVLRMRVDGQDAPGTARLNLDMGGNTHRYRGTLDLGVDLQPGVPVDVEVSADLPAGGETRWLYYDLVPDVCVVPSQGQYAGTLGGPLARRVDPGERGAFAKILRSPIGGWALQIETRERGEDLNFVIQLDDPPQAGSSVSVSDGGMTDFDIGGGVDDPESVGWLSGDAQITWSKVVPRPGKPFSWVCGTLSATLVGIKEPPPGSATPVQVPATFSGRFWAEWHH